MLRIIYFFHHDIFVLATKLENKCTPTIASLHCFRTKPEMKFLPNYILDPLFQNTLPVGVLYFSRPSPPPLFDTASDQKLGERSGNNGNLLASFPGPAQLSVASSTEKRERAWNNSSRE